MEFQIASCVPSWALLYYIILPFGYHIQGKNVDLSEFPCFDCFAIL